MKLPTSDFQPVNPEPRSLTPAFPPRNRLWYVGFFCLVIVAGLASRRFGPILPKLIAAYAGDTLWALMVFLGFGILWPKRSPLWLAAMAAGFSYLIEFSQIYHAPWIDAIRQNRLGGLVLGRGFLWSDLVCYTIGILIGFGLETIWSKMRATHHTSPQ